MDRLLGDLAAQGAEVVRAAGVAPETIANTYTVDMRHVGQGHEITVALPPALFMMNTRLVSGS